MQSQLQSNGSPIPEAEAESFDYESTVADAVSAVAEFEQDMAMAQPEIKVPVATTPRYAASLDEEPTRPPETATSEELMQEAGLDDATTLAGRDAPAVEPV